jgi:hypothetical protein
MVGMATHSNLLEGKNFQRMKDGCGRIEREELERSR